MKEMESKKKVVKELIHAMNKMMADQHFGKKEPKVEAEVDVSKEEPKEAKSDISQEDKDKIIEAYIKSKGE